MKSNGRDPLIEVLNVSRSFRLGDREYHALRGVTLSIQQGSLVAVTGKSGSGKSTLLNLLAGIDRPSSGNVRIGGRHIESLTEEELALWRGENAGVVFQFFQLIPTLTVLENVVLPMDFSGTLPRNKRRERAMALLDRVGIQEQAGKLPSSLSGGQQQRAAIARALANDPPLILADEPTGNLDSETSNSIFRLFAELASQDKTIVVVTHEREFTRYFSEHIHIADGRVQHPQPVVPLKEVM